MPGYFTESKTLFLKRTWGQKTSPLFLWYILVNFMDQDPCTKLYGVLISFHEVRNFHSFEFGVSDVIPPNVRKTFASGFSCISFLILWRTSNNKHDWTSVKYLHLLYHSRIHKQLQHVFLNILGILGMLDYYHQNDRIICRKLSCLSSGKNQLQHSLLS